ncbi:MocR-like pyridoxine biosynthesis transcription factor PdxR [Sphingobacterium sp. MYb382]|uniref:MocR-like pyridoxine biosynthesis transcription factor PdxR n=1 Tax=Sphingobacterium sp. MYb382 TaxID=2745278 RepID=UPI0030B4A134
MAQNLPYKSLIQLKRKSDLSLHIQISTRFISLITNGTLLPKSPLPSTRVLADLIGVNRNTVKLAYEELISQGWADSVARKGVFVISSLPLLKKQIAPPPVVDYEDSFSWNNKFETLPFSPNFQTNMLTVDDGFPDVRLTPVDFLMREYRSISKKFYGKSFLKYGSSKGSERLRATLSKYVSTTRGLQVNLDNILITKGSQMGIYLAAHLLLSSSDYIAVGINNYGPADSTFKLCGAQLLRIPIDDFGMDIDYLAKLLEHIKIKAVYIIPHHHFPTTVTMSVERRLKLLNLAKHYRFAIIEDDYDYDFHYSNSPYIPLASIDHNNNVIYIGSITKTFAPALRIGFLIGPPKFVDNASELRQLIDKQGDSLLEEAFASLIENGDLERHFRKCLKIYKYRRDLFCQILKSDFNDVITYKVPEGGLAVWSCFDEKIDLLKLSQKVAKQGLRLGDGTFYKNEVFDVNGLRLGFASLNEMEMQEALNILKKNV